LNVETFRLFKLSNVSARLFILFE